MNRQQLKALADFAHDMLDDHECVMAPEDVIPIKDAIAAARVYNKHLPSQPKEDR